MLIALSFLIPLQLLDLTLCIYTSIGWGLFLISIFSFYLARSQNENPTKIVIEHVLIAIIVVLLAHFIGDIIHEFFIQ